MQYAELAQLYAALEQQSSRLAKSDNIATFLQSVSSDELRQLLLLLQGRVHLHQENKESGIAEKLVVKALAQIAGSASANIINLWKEHGDLGVVAEQVCTHRKQSVLVQHAPLSVNTVFTSLQKLAHIEGEGSLDKKLQVAVGLLSAASPQEAKYLTRTLLEDLRIGVGEGIVRDAIVHAYLFAFPEKMTAEQRVSYNVCVNVVQHAYDLTNDFALVAVTAKEQGTEGLSKLQLQLGRPLNVMLALKASSVKAALDAAERPAAVEYKFDGFRVQIHKGKDIRLFTRRLEDVTLQFPDVVAAVRQHVTGDCILDTEIVGIHPTTKKYVPFQHISKRIKRKYNIAMLAKKLPVEINVFDIMFHDGTSLLDKTFSERRVMLEKVIAPEKFVIQPSIQIITSDEQQFHNFFVQAQQQGNEGVMVKNLSAPYKPGARVGYMLKYKETLETLDVIIVGAEWGKGKRSQWMSSFDIACADGEQFLEIGKVATGLKEKPEEGLSFQELTELLRPHILKENSKHLTLRPSVVIEVAYEELQKSSAYGSRYALRFPRVMRLRPDKGPAEVSSLSLVKQIFEEQRF